MEAGAPQEDRAEQRERGRGIHRYSHTLRMSKTRKYVSTVHCLQAYSRNSIAVAILVALCFLAKPSCVPPSCAGAPDLHLKKTPHMLCAILYAVEPPG